MLPKLVILDCDGTLYRGEEVVFGALQAVNALRNSSCKIKFVTNNSSLTQAGLAGKLCKLGFNCEPSEVLGTAFSTAQYLKSQGIKSALVVGEQGLCDELNMQGINAKLANDDPVSEVRFDAVVAGICKSLSYEKISQAMNAVLNGAIFVATNSDSGYPLAGGKMAPGAGATVGAIAGATGKNPKIIGKPEPYMIELILSETGLKPEEIFVVGDRFETDIEFGIRAGCQTYQVLTGVTSELKDGQLGGNNLLEFLKYLGIKN